MEEKNTSINDPLEGRAIWRQDADTNSDFASDNERVAIGRIGGIIGIDALSGSNNTFSGNVIEEETSDFHMMCFTHLPPDISKKVFCRRYVGINEPYDACIEFRNIENLFDHINNFAKIRDNNGNFSIPVADIFHRVLNGNVQYSERVVSWREQMPTVTPFHKDVSFECQGEHRLVFEASHPLPDELYAFVPNLSDFIRLIDLDKYGV